MQMDMQAFYLLSDLLADAVLHSQKVDSDFLDRIETISYAFKKIHEGIKKVNEIYSKV